MASERLEWVEIIDPSSRNIMFANLTTGQCVWDPPEDVPVKKFDDHQWWELYDANTSRFYYYNATSQKTVWHRPQNCDIIPLAKLQQIKQNTEVVDGVHSFRNLSKDSISTQTPYKQPSQKDSNFTPRSLHRSLTTSTTQTSPAPSPKPIRRGSHHHHRSHHSSSCPHQHHLDANGDIGRRIRRSSQSSQSSSISYSKPYKESGRLSDSSMSQSRTSLESSASRLKSSPHDAQDLKSRSGRTDQIRCSSDHLTPSPRSPEAMESGSRPANFLLASPSTPCGRRRCPKDAHTQIAKQRSFEASNYCRNEPNADRPKDMALSRSYSFVSRPKYHEEEGMHERFLFSGMRSVESTPQPRRKHRGLDAVPGSPDSAGSQGRFNCRQRSDSSGLESLATPLMHRKQRSLETTAKATKGRADLRPSSSAHTRLVASDSSPSPQSPRREFSPFAFDSPKCPDSGASTLTDKETRSHCGRGSADSSPHSQVDSGLVSGTTGSRGSADSSLRRTIDSRQTTLDREQPPGRASRSSTEKENRRCGHHRRHHCSKHRPTAAVTVLQNATDSDRSDTLQSSNSSLQLHQSSNNSQNQNSSSASSTTAQQSSPNNSNSKLGSPATGAAAPSKQQSSPVGGAVLKKDAVSPQHRDMTHLYSNLDYVYDQPVYQYIMEQAKLSGYRFGDTLNEDGDSLHSDDSGGMHDDSDDFADDEGMSNADSSSQEYLDDVNYLADDETYMQFFTPSYVKVPPESPKDKVDGRDPNSVEKLSNLSIRTPSSSSSTSTNVTITNRCPPTGVLSGLPSHVSYHQRDSSQGSVVPSEVQFGSLRRKKEPAPPPPPQAPPPPQQFPTHEKFEPRMIVFHGSREPTSESDVERISIAGSIEAGGVTTNSNMMEKYAQENLNIHTRGILRKKVPVIDMISWTKDPIRKPMLSTIDKSLKNQACEMFKALQIYMRDRKPKLGMTLNSVGLEIVTMAYNNPGLRDELFVQICRQTTENPGKDSLRRGWELMAICLEFLPPSVKFAPYLAGYIAKHCDAGYQTMFPEISKWPVHIQINHYAGVCDKRLERTSVNAKHQRLKKPTLEEIDLARLHIFRASMFGGTLEEIMALQRERYPHRRLPWVQTTLSEEVLRLQGTDTEGIFRVPADFDEVHQLKQIIDQWEVGNCGDPHVMAALLKLWYRELYEPLIPDTMYGLAIDVHDQPPKAVALVNQLPEMNRLVLAYLIRFLQYFAQAEIVTATKMDANNLSMVMAPNCLRCTSDDPKIMYENTRKEMAFIRTLIQNLDTTFIEGVV